MILRKRREVLCHEPGTGQKVVGETEKEKIAGERDLLVTSREEADAVERDFAFWLFLLHGAGGFFRIHYLGRVGRRGRVERC
jgi:hypothetical protein